MATQTATYLQSFRVRKHHSLLWLHILYLQQCLAIPSKMQN